jgi:hypothetical protein
MNGGDTPMAFVEIEVKRPGDLAAGAAAAPSS